MSGPRGEQNYTLASVISNGVQRALDDVHTCFPARVVRYDAGQQQVDVLPLVQRIYYDENGERQTDTPPVICNVPVVFPGAGAFSITWPINADDQNGDTVLVHCAEVSLDLWLSQDGNDLDPQDERRFALSDAVAVPGLRSFQNAIANVPTDKACVGSPGGLALYIDGSKIRIGDSDDSNLDAGALAGAVNQAFQNVVNWLTSHTHAYSGPSGNTLASTQPPPSIPTLGSASVMVKK